MVTLPGSAYLLLVTLAGMAYRLRNMPKKTTEAQRPLRFAVIIPAHNESINLLVAVNSLKSCQQPCGSYDLVVIADNCTDDTADIARKAGCFVLERKHDTLLGKGYALEFAFDKLIEQDYDAFIVVDADTRCENNFVVELEKRLAAGSEVLQVPYFVDDSMGSFYSQIVNIGFRAFNYLRPSAREQLGLSAGIFGTGFALKRNVVEDVPYTANSIVEDVEYHISLVRAGYRSRFVSETRVYSAMPESSDNAKTQRSRWEGGRLRLILDRSWPLLKEILSGNWRLLDPLLELLLLPLWIHVTLILLLLISSLPYLALYGLVSFGIVVAHVIVAILSTGGGIKELKVLILVPKYIIWKILISQTILEKSEKTAKWDRTPRD